MCWVRLQVVYLFSLWSCLLYYPFFHLALVYVFDFCLRFCCGIVSHFAFSSYCRVMGLIG